MQSIKSSDYEWHQRDDRGHHLIIFTLPEELQAGDSADFKFSCSLPTWTPTHGSVKKWDALSLDDNRIGLLVPRMWWNIFFWWLPKEYKIKQFSIKN